jgi:guanylate kinase
MRQSPHGCLFIVSAPSGTGKSTLCRMLLKHRPRLRYSISTTTRPPRPGETDGKDYHFTDIETFKAGIAAGRWAEWAEVHGNYYGTSAHFIDQARAAGHDVLLDIDVQGAEQLRSTYPDAVTIFILPPSSEALRQRLEQRGTDAPEVIARRISNARAEMAQRTTYQHVLVNDQIEDALQALLVIIDGAGSQASEKAPGSETGTSSQKIDHY